MQGINKTINNSPFRGAEAVHPVRDNTHEHSQAGSL